MTQNSQFSMTVNLTAMKKWQGLFFLHSDEGLFRLMVKLSLFIVCLLTSLNPAFSSIDSDSNSNPPVTITMGSSGIEMQQIRVTGQITEEKTGEPLIGVNIFIEGTTTGTISDLNGFYTITVPNANSVLIFRFVGYIEVHQMVGNNTLINLSMTESLSVMEEVVVVGYGTQRKVSVTGAITSVAAAELIKSPVGSISNALAGRSPGLITIQSSGEPGRNTAELFIRGRATTGNTQPLILVDGVERSMDNLDMNEVSSINILKDASATAVYGVRGANGVIIVTTKSGLVGSKPKVSFTANYGIQNFARNPRLLTATEWIKMYDWQQYNDAANKDAWNPLFSGEEIELYRSGADPIFHPDNDWFEMLLGKNAPSSQQNINISGGNQKVKYFVSIGHFGETGFYGDAVSRLSGWEANPLSHRYNIRVNTDFQWTKKFSTSVRFARQILRNTGPNKVLTSILNGSAVWAPIYGKPFIDGKYINQTDGLTLYGSNNHMMQFFNEGYRVDHNSTSNVDITSRYDLGSLLDGLSVRGKFSYDTYYFQHVRRHQAWDQYNVKRIAPGYAGNHYTLVQTVFASPWSSTESHSQNVKLYGEAALDYNKEFAGKHLVSGLLLATMERTYTPTKNNAAVTPLLPFNYMGIVSRVTYSYEDRYMGEVNMGYNGSENFRVGNQFGFFPSFSLGYVISEESFFPQNEVLTFMKVRGSYGLVGNDNIGAARFPYTPSSFSEQANTAYFGRTTVRGYEGYNENTIGNPGIGWEVSKKGNIGAEMRLFSDKLSVTGDLFKEMREGIFGKYNNVASTFGPTSILPSFNLGIVENKGYEIETEFRNTTPGGFHYWIGGNYSFARNKRVYFDEVPPAYDNLRQTGYPINQPYWLNVTGFYTSWEEINDPNRIKSIWESGNPIRPGDYIYEDVNGDKVIDTNDRKPIGYSNVPEIFFGINMGLRWKNFDIYALIQGADHVMGQLDAGTFGFGAYGAIRDISYEQWNMEKYLSGDEIKYPRATNLTKTAGHNFQGNSNLIENARYIRLKNLEAGYNFEKNIISVIGMESLRVYVNGQNILTATPMRQYDPEIFRSSGNIGRGKYPVSIVYNIGVRANF